MEIGQKVKIINTGDIWENKTGILEYIDDGMVTVLVDFKDDKKVRQDFNIEDVEPVSDETNTESDNQNFIDDEQTNEAVNTPVEKSIDTSLKEHYNNEMKEAKPLMEQTEEKDKKIELLAKYLNVDPSTITASNQENTYDVEDEDAQYIVCTGDEAHDYAAEDIREIFDESGLDAFSPNFQDWILDNAIDGSYFEDAQDEYNRSYVDDIADENSFIYDNRLIEELYESNILTDDDFNKDENGEVDYTSLKDSVDLDSKKDEYVEQLNSNETSLEWAKDMYSPEELADAIKDNNAIDIDAVVEECIDEDGVAHFIASYDDNEIDLGDGLFAYRIN